ncbi:MAG: hypothetical protein PHF73_06240 [Massilibacteroides sp.]|nr:hypothetical protein [Massilibacteroides sp.]
MPIIIKSFSILFCCLISNIALIVTVNASNNQGASEKDEYLNITSFGTLCYWNIEDSLLGYEIKDNLFYSTEKKQDNIGIRWWKTRDIQRFEITFDKKISEETTANRHIEYWQDTWPDQPPHMSSFDDLEDDLWRGKWIVANTCRQIKGNKVIYTFNPLGEKEISSAKNFPGEVTYRRTLKMRIKIPSKDMPDVRKIDAFSMAILQKEKIRIEFLIESDNKKEKKNGKIWLGNGIPNRWLEPGEKVELKNLCTRYGKFSYNLKHSDELNTIHAEIWMPEECPRTIMFIHDPFQKPIREVSVNGQNWTAWNEMEKSVVLPKGENHIQLIINY